MKIRYITITIAFSLLSNLLLAAEHETQKKLITIDDSFKIKSVASPKLTPDGNWLAYDVSTTILEEDESYHQIWMVPTAGGEAIPLTAVDQDSWSPHWSKDGKWLYFLSARGGDRTQVWKLNMAHGGEAIQVTRMETRGVSSIQFSSDEKKLLMVLHDRDPEEIKEEEDENYIKPTSKPPYVIDRLQFKEDYTGYLNHQRDHVYIYDIPSHKLTQITSGDFDDSSPDWSPDDKWITFASNRSDNPDGNYNVDIWVVSSSNSDTGQDLRKLSGNQGEDGSPIWSPDGKWIAYYSKKEELHVYGLYRLSIIPAGGGEATVLSETQDRNVSSFQWSADSKRIYTIIEDHGMENLVSFKISDASMEQVMVGKHSVWDYEINNTGIIVAKISTPAVPGEIYTVDSGKLRKVTSVNDELMSQFELSDIETFTYKSVDDWEIEGFIYKPIGYEAGRKYPTILRIHGGPMAQYGYSFAIQAQLFAANGYLVVRTNPRGSTGYGEKFALGIAKDWGNKDYKDVMGGVDYTIEKGYADPERLGVGGWSYGGALTNYIITSTTRFKAATTGASSSTNLANYGHDMYHKWYEYEYGLPWEGNNRELYEKQAPINYVENVRTPTLILCGEKDWNVPVMNSEILYQSLKRLGVDTQLIVYPDQSHGGFPPSYDKDVYERYLAWFNKYLKF